MAERRAVRWDGAMYLISAAVAGVAAAWDTIPLQRAWGVIAFPPYLLGASAAFTLAAVWRRLSPRFRSRARTVIAAAVLLGTAAAPLALEVWWRDRDGYRGHVQSEVLVTEDSAKTLLSGSNPYASSFAAGPLGSWPAGTAEHVPYLPGIFLFGMPRALAGGGAWTDARIAFALVTVAAAAAALRLARAPRGRGLTAAIVLLALPTGARYMTGGGDDVTVLSLMLLSLVLLRRGDALGAGLVAGAAGIIKQTAWPLLPFLVVAARDREGRPARRRALAGIAAVVLPTLAPFALADPGAFVEDVVFFPLGLADDPTLAASPTVGRLLATVFPDAAVAVVAVLLVLGAGVAMLRLAPPLDARGAAERAALVSVLAIPLATAGRYGYLLYPIGLLLWGRLILDPARPSPSTVRVASAVARDRALAALPAGTSGAAGIPEELEPRIEAEEADRADQQGQEPDEEPLEEAADRQHAPIVDGVPRPVR